MQSSHQNSEKDNSNVESRPDQSSEVIQSIVEELEDDNLEEEEDEYLDDDEEICTIHGLEKQCWRWSH